MFSRRRFLSAAGIALMIPRIAFAGGGGDRRFVFIIQRGAADGLNIVVPYAEPAYASLRGALAIDAASATKLDGMFALHPALEHTASLYGAGQALFLHAAASPYRDRSHFDGQNVLETGGAAPYREKDGWLNRLAGLLPPTRERAIALAPTVPPALRGTVEVASYAPSALPRASDDLMERVSRLYEQDGQLHALWASAMTAREQAGDSGNRQDAATIGRQAAAFLARDDGPRIAMIETNGWDTHTGQKQRLANQLKALDTLLDAMREGLGAAWDKTTILVATEFGRTAAANGTGGTDHGTASVAMLVGGAVAGGRVIADWPGLRPGDLYEGRDLRPTLRLDDLIAGAAAEGLGLDPERVAATLFPQAGKVRPLANLVGGRRT
jgi:uncharacterized protein (DUF1501 family)